MIASGAAKAAAVAAALEGPETLDVPASLLRRHPRVSCFLDEAAAAELSPATREHASGQRLRVPERAV